MSRDEWVELIMIVVAAIAMVTLAVALVQGRVAHSATTPLPAAQCFKPYVGGEAAPMKEELIPHSHGECMRILVYSMWSACEEQKEKADKETCYSYFMVPGRLECKPVSCAGGVTQPRESL